MVDSVILVGGWVFKISILSIEDDSIGSIASLERESFFGSSSLSAQIDYDHDYVIMPITHGFLFELTRLNEHLTEKHNFRQFLNPTLTAVGDVYEYFFGVVAVCNV